jgi:mono/diheme cytochrome c family protein
MKRTALSGIFVMCAFVWPAFAETPLSPEAKAGRDIAERICSRCHAIGPEGVSPHKDAPPFRYIAAKGNVENLEEALAEGIVVGHPDMPQFQFGPRDVGAIVAYLKSMSGKS